MPLQLKTFRLTTTQPTTRWRTTSLHHLRRRRTTSTSSCRPSDQSTSSPGSPWPRGQFIDTRTMVVISADSVFRRFHRRGEASAHHRVAACARLLPPTWRSINSSQQTASVARFRRCGEASAHHKVAACARLLPPTWRSINSSQQTASVARFRRCGEASAHHRVAACARLPPLTWRSIDSSQRGGVCSPATADVAEHRLITERRRVLACYRQRGGASAHHREAACARLLPPTWRSIDSSQRGGVCSPATANGAEHHLITSTPFAGAAGSTPFAGAAGSTFIAGAAYSTPFAGAAGSTPFAGAAGSTFIAGAAYSTLSCSDF